MTTTQTKLRPKPFLFPQLCKACGRCIEACPKHCIEFATAVNPQSGLTPIVVHEELCNGCGTCMEKCPWKKIPSDFDLSENYAQKELAKKVRQIIDGLSAKYRDVLILRFLEDKSYEEIRG